MPANNFFSVEYLCSFTQPDSLRLNNTFCFLQTKHGNILAVQYNRNESDDVINLKKRIAAAFQANFGDTPKVIEVDPLSKHWSHYR